MTVMDVKRNADITTLKRLLSKLLHVTNLIFPHSKNIFARYLILMYRSYVVGKASSTVSFKCVSVPDGFLKKLIPDSFKNLDPNRSFENCILLNSKFVQTSVEPYTLTPVNLNNTYRIVGRSGGELKRFVEVIATQKLPYGEAVISETFCCNLKSPFKSSHGDDISITLISKSKDDLIFGAQYATKIVVALIHTPNEVHQDLVKHCLTSYFEKAHLLCVGDIFVVNVCLHMPEAFYVPGYEHVKLLYFKVQELEGPPYNNISNAEKSVGYLVVKNETTLLQTDIQSFVPSSVFYHCWEPPELSLENYKRFLIPNCPPSLDKLRNLMVSALQPFLNNSKTYIVHSLKPVFWLIGPTGSGKQCLLDSLALYFGIHLWNFDCDEVFGKLSGQTEGRLKAVFSKARTFTPCIMMLSNIQSLCKDAEGHEDLRIITLFNDLLLEVADFPLIVIATSNTEASVPPSLARIFLQTFVVPLFTEEDRRRQLKWFVSLRGATIAEDCLDFAAGRSSGFLFNDLDALVAHAIRNGSQRAHSQAETVKRQSMLLIRTDFEEAIGKMQSAYSDAIGAPKIPAVTWDDVGGLGSVKEEILRTVTTPLHHPELVAAGLRRSGVLLYGPPGTGKTLIAKAVATECGLNFLSVKGPELLNMYVGQSEENVREVFERARAASPCIVFFDELDSLAPNRGRSGDSGGVMDRVVSQLLAEMDGLQKSTHLFVIGATNRPDLIDPALLRPGRFDKLLYVSACEDEESITCVLQALTRKFNLSKDIDIKDLTKAIPKQVTGADIYAVCSNAWRNAVRRAIKSLTSGLQDEVPTVEVSQDDFILAISEMNPSVSAADMRYFKNLEQELFGSKSHVLAN